MRKRDRLGCWQQLLTLLGTSLLSERDWVKLYRNFLRSWKRIYYLKLYESHDVARAPPPADVVSAPGRHRYTMAAVSGPSVSLSKRRNSLAPPSAPTIHPIKRRKSLAEPSVPSIHPIKRRQSLAQPSVPLIQPTKSLHSKGQICDTAKRKNSVAAPDFDINEHKDLLLKPIKRRDSAIPELIIQDSDEFCSPIKRRHSSIALDQWMRPMELISPLAPSPMSHRDSLSSNLGMNRKRSVSPSSCPIRIKRRVSLVSVPPKSSPPLPKPQQKPKSVVKHVTGSGDELDDEMSLAAWKKYSAQRKAMNTKSKPLGSPAANICPPLQMCPKQVQVVVEPPPVKRKRGRPSREEKAKRLLEEEQALKMQQQALATLMEPSIKKSTSSDQKSGKSAAKASVHRPLDARKKQQQKTASQSHKQKPTAKPARCQSTCSSFSGLEGSDIAKHSNDLVQPAILDEDAIPPAHMPAKALDLKSAPKIPGDTEGERRADTEGEEDKEEEEDEGQPKSGYNSSENGRSMYNRILGTLSSDEKVEDEQQLLLQQTGFVFNDYEVEEQLIDNAMELASRDDDKDALIIDLDLLVSEDNAQPEISFNQCEEATTIDNSETKAQGLEINASASANDHTTEFFENLLSRPPVDVNADKANLLWPFMDDDEVLDYEPDYDVLTLVVSSDELEDECLGKSKKETTKTESRNESNTQNVQVKSPKPEMPPSKPLDQPDIPQANGLRAFRIPRLNPELLKAQPAVMHALYLQEDGAQIKEKVKPVVEQSPCSEEVRKRREEAMAARSPKETTPQFAPPFRSTREEESAVPKDLSQPPIFGPQDLVAPPPLFGPDDLAPISVPPGNYPREESQHYPPQPFVPNLLPRNLLPEVQPQPQQQQPNGVSQYMAQNLVTRGGRNTRPAEGERNKRPTEVSSPPCGLAANHWMKEIFGAKCLGSFDNKCLAANCDHAMSPVGEVERRLFGMPEEALIHTYRQALRSFYIFERFFKCFANIFERRKLYKHLLQMLANSRLYRNLTVAIINHVFPALKRCGLEREATGCLMTDLWMPDKAHKFRELTLTILQILEAANWQDYIDQLVELHKKYKFLLSDEFMIRIMKWADVTKNETLQITSIVMLTADMATYNRNPTIISLVNRFSNPDSNSQLPLQSPASNLTEPHQIPSLIPQQQQNPLLGTSLIRKTPAIRQPQPPPQQYPAIWNCNPNINQNFVTQQERLLGGAGAPGPSLIGSNLVHKPPPHWTHNPNPNPNHFRELPGASSGPSLIRSTSLGGQPLLRSTPLVGQHQEQQHQQQQQQYSASTWRS